jgi:NAD(P)-dependent dehydrogenase (short-subunit alcohol dehydrogenase family)
VIGSLLDTILDRTAVAGYTSAGYRIRRHTWDADDLRSMAGKTVLVTGATSGLGLASAEGFARLGASVRLLARNQERGERASAAVVEATGNRDVRVRLWAERLAGTGVVVHAMHPGWADTPSVASSLPRFHRITGPLLRSAEEGADTIVWLGAAVEPGESSGSFWHDRRQRPTHRVSWTRETPADRERLWRECERLTGRHAAPLPAPARAHE